MVGIVEHTATSVGVFGGSSSGIRGIKVRLLLPPLPFVSFSNVFVSDGNRSQRGGGGWLVLLIKDASRFFFSPRVLAP
jgi:hypothetical protein